MAEKPTKRATSTPAPEPAATALDPALSYEAAREELIDVVRRLEAGGTTLEESLALWERGEALAAACEQRLAGARQRLDQVLGASED